MRIGRALALISPPTLARARPRTRRRTPRRSGAPGPARRSGRGWRACCRSSVARRPPGAAPGSTPSTDRRRRAWRRGYPPSGTRPARSATRRGARGRTRRPPRRRPSSPAPSCACGRRGGSRRRPRASGRGRRGGSRAWSRARCGPASRSPRARRGSVAPRSGPRSRGGRRRTTRSARRRRTRTDTRLSRGQHGTTEAHREEAIGAVAVGPGADRAGLVDMGVAGRGLDGEVRVARQEGGELVGALRPREGADGVHEDAADVAALARTQAGLLDAAAARVASGGVLVYAVCTFTRAEGADQLAAFLT
ncbi:MAG: hypothetical protein K8M05_23330, partial [Deltaproteobacteria bacterium]|nr:hypothetical protein [Kofleriaceae bacterium]